VGRAVEDDARQARVHLVQRHQLHLFLSSCNVQHATCNVQRAAWNMQHATCSMQRATLNVQHGTCSMQRATCNTSRCHSGDWSHRFLPQSLTAAARVQRSEAPPSHMSWRPSIRCKSRSVRPSRGGPSLCPRDATSVSVLPGPRVRARVHACVYVRECSRLRGGLCGDEACGRDEEGLRRPHKVCRVDADRVDDEPKLCHGVSLARTAPRGMPSGTPCHMGYHTARACRMGYVG
jgi:hypothetical protein